LCVVRGARGNILDGTRSLVASHFSTIMPYRRGRHSIILASLIGVVTTVWAYVLR
jgi:hypothetical protein